MNTPPDVIYDTSTNPQANQEPCRTSSSHATTTPIHRYRAPCVCLVSQIVPPAFQLFSFQGASRLRKVGGLTLFRDFTHELLLYPFYFFFNDPATTEIYTLSLHDALPI